VLRAASAGIGAGEHLLSVKVVDNDAEPRTDERLVHLSVVATPGVVFVANPVDWDARFLFRTIREVAALPARVYVRIGESWRTMTDLKPVSEDVMRQAIRGADLVVLKGRAVDRAGDLRGRGAWLWPGGGGDAAAQDGDWYLTLRRRHRSRQRSAGCPSTRSPLRWRSPRRNQRHRAGWD
jgi:hypothetical protein